MEGLLEDSEKKYIYPVIQILPIWCTGMGFNFSRWNGCDGIAGNVVTMFIFREIYHSTMISIASNSEPSQSCETPTQNT
jgi:hypothetical protein